MQVGDHGERRRGHVREGVQMSTYAVFGHYGAETYVDYVVAHDEREAISDASLPASFEGEQLDDVTVEVIS